MKRVTCYIEMWLCEMVNVYQNQVKVHSPPEKDESFTSNLGNKATNYGDDRTIACLQPASRAAAIADLLWLCCHDL